MSRLLQGESPDWDLGGNPGSPSEEEMEWEVWKEKRGSLSEIRRQRKEEKGEIWGWRDEKSDRERGREKDTGWGKRETERQRERKTERNTEKERERKTEKERDRQKERE